MEQRARNICQHEHCYDQHYLHHQQQQQGGHQCSREAGQELGARGPCRQLRPTPFHPSSCAHLLLLLPLGAASQVVPQGFRLPASLLGKMWPGVRERVESMPHAMLPEAGQLLLHAGPLCAAA